MSTLLVIVCGVILLGVLVVIHEGGHFLMSRAFGVRVSEFMIGLPGPRIGFKWRGTKFGVTAVPLGGYARVAGMELGPESPHLQKVLACVYDRGTVVMEDVAYSCGISTDEALAALDELVEWGSIAAPRKADPYNIYRTVEVREGFAVVAEEGVAHPIADPEAFFEEERRQQYRSLPFWKRCMILFAGPGANLLFFMLVLVLVYTIIGVDVQNAQGEIEHMTIGPLRALYVGCCYIVAVVQAISGLFNPATAAETVSNSTSIVGIAVMSKSAFEQGLVSFTMFGALISVSLGLMNLLPIPPLDGGRIVVEIIQKVTGRDVPPIAMGAVTTIAMVAFILFFLFMLNQDVQRFVFGNW